MLVPLLNGKVEFLSLFPHLGCDHRNCLWRGKSDAECTVPTVCLAHNCCSEAASPVIFA